MLEVSFNYICFLCGRKCIYKWQVDEEYVMPRKVKSRRTWPNKIEISSFKLCCTCCKAYKVITIVRDDAEVYNYAGKPLSTLFTNNCTQRIYSVPTNFMKNTEPPRRSILSLARSHWWSRGRLIHSLGTLEMFYFLYYYLFFYWNILTMS